MDHSNTERGYRLYLDDLRPIPAGWVGARSLAEFQQLIETRGLPMAISFDHDLGTVDGTDGGALAPTGMDAAHWLCDRGYDLRGVDLRVHSANPVGAANIRGLLESYLRHLDRDVRD